MGSVRSSEFICTQLITVMLLNTATVHSTSEPDAQITRKITHSVEMHTHAASNVVNV